MDLRKREVERTEVFRQEELDIRRTEVQIRQLELRATLDLRKEELELRKAEAEDRKKDSRLQAVLQYVKDNPEDEMARKMLREFLFKN